MGDEKEMLFHKNKVVGIFSVLIGAMLCSCDQSLDEFVVRQDVPISACQIHDDLFCLIPENVINVYYLECSAGLQSFELFVRFDFGASSPEQIITEIVDHNDKALGKTFAYERLSLKDAEGVVVRDAVRPLLWWDIDSLISGYYVGSRESYGMRIWVDTAKNTIYIYQSD